MTLSTASQKTKPLLLAGWGNCPQASCHLAEPADAAADWQNFESFPHLIARGMGRSYGDASLAPAGSLVVGTRWQNKFLAFDRAQGLLTAQAGVTLGEIIDVTVPAGWFLSVTPGTRHVSLGGALASNIHGKNHHAVGAIVQFVESLRVLTEQGVFDCSRTQHAELFFATVGGYGLTGLITQATLRLKKIETAWIDARFVKVPDLDTAMAVSLELEKQFEYSVVWIDSLARGKHFGRGIVMAGNHAKLSDLAGAAAAAQPLHNAWSPTLSAPRKFPGWVLNNATNRVFNFAYAHRFPGREARQLVRFEPWFFPLDRVAGWNRFYGGRGFVEYQCALPLATAAAGGRELLERIRRAGLGSFLSVFKRIGDDAAMLPFAMPGWTLAMDFGVRGPELFPVLDELDKIVLQHGGKIYLSKDARLKADTFRAMYPELPRWMAVVEKFNPARRFQSRLSQRLQL